MRNRNFACPQSEPTDTLGLTRLARGQPYSISKPSMGQRFEMTRGVPFMLFSSAHPSGKEVRGARTAPVDLALVPGGQHTLFLLVRVPGLVVGWADMPYSHCVVLAEMRALPRRRLGSDGSAKGCLFQLYLTGSGGIIHVIRGLSMSPQFAAVLDGLCNEQERSAGTFSQAAHEDEHRAAYGRWETSDAMLSSAVIVERAATEFSLA